MIKLKRKEFATALQHAGRLIKSEGSSPVLRCVYGIAANEALYLTSTDGNSWLSIGVPCGGGEIEPFVVDYVSIRKFISSCSGEEVVIRSSPRGIIIECEPAKAKFPIYPAMTFPGWPEFSAEIWVSIEGQELKRILKRVWTSAGDNLAMPAMLGYQLEVLGSTLSFTATNGKQLAHSETKDFKVLTAGKDISVVLPRSGAEYLLNAEGSVTLGLSRVKMSASWGMFSLTSRLIDLPFPDWKRLLANRPTNKLTFQRDDLASAFKAVSHLGPHAGVKIGAQEMTIWNAADHGSVVVKTACQADQDGEIYVVSAQAVEFLSAIEEEEVALRWTEARGMVLIEDGAHPQDAFLTMGCVPIPPPAEELSIDD
jgi:DNA polymerase III sliding clamp (beta) subunit (PCNA family)